MNCDLCGRRAKRLLCEVCKDAVSRVIGCVMRSQEVRQAVLDSKQNDIIQDALRRFSNGQCARRAE